MFLSELPEIRQRLGGHDTPLIWTADFMLDTASDGTETPTRVVELAAEAGLTTIALTDHDTLHGIEEARQAAADKGIHLIPGVELSIERSVGALHLLVYFLEPERGPLQDRLAELRQGRHHRNREMVDALVGMGIAITYDEVLAEAGTGAVGRPHIASVLAAKGVVADVTEAFEGESDEAFKEADKKLMPMAEELSRRVPRAGSRRRIARDPGH